MVPDSAAAATVTAAVVVIVAAAAIVVVAATAAGVAAGAAAAAADENEDEDDPQAAVAAPTVVPTHKLEPPVRDGDRRAVSVHLILQIGHGSRRELQGPAAAGAEQLYGAVIDLQLPVPAAAGAGDAVPQADVPQFP